jgi:exopolyphosphatase/guanosine-5'-triphosphate,3'-diphosphate pyrophosphatase
MAYTRAVIDLGTNTFQLLVGSSHHPDAPLHILENVQRPVQLGQGAMKNGLIQQDAEERANIVLAEFVSIAAFYGCLPSDITAVGTSILRNALNGNQILSKWGLDFGFQVELISGLQEATHIFEGVFHSLPQPWVRPTLLMDIGGGSVEFILFEGNVVHYKTSLELGGLKLRSLYHVHDAFDLAIKSDCLTYIRKELQPLFDACGQVPEVLVGAAGAFETMLDIEQALIGGFRNGSAQVLDLPCFYRVKEEIEELGADQRTSYPGMRAFRAGIFPYANLLVDSVLSHFGIQEMWMSASSLKEGYWIYQRAEAIKKGIIF